MAKSNDDHEKQEIKKDIDKQQNRRKKYEQLEGQLKESGKAQISTLDPDSRHIIVRNNITEVAYCIQSTVDTDHNIPIDFLITIPNYFGVRE